MTNACRWLKAAVLLFVYIPVIAQTPTPSVEQGLHIKNEITVGDILTLVTIAISLVGALIGLLISSHKDRVLRRKEYADRIRLASGSVIAKLERWRELSLRFFGDIQATLTDTDIKLVKEKDVIAARDFLWRNLHALRAQSTLRIVDEEIEIAYSGLYGYDPNIHRLYVAAVEQLKAIDLEIYMRLATDTQDNVLSFGDRLSSFGSAELGNQLRETSGRLVEELGHRLTDVIDEFRTVMIRLIEADDMQIVERRIDVLKS